MARKKRINKRVLLIIVGLVLLAGMGASWHFRRQVWHPIRDYLFPKDAAVIEKQGDTAYEAGEYVKALTKYRHATYWYQQAGKLSSQDRAEFKAARARLYVAWRSPNLTDTERREHYGMAIATLRKLLRRSPKYAEPQRLLCDIAWSEALRSTRAGAGHWERCVQENTALLAIEPNDHQSYFRRGYANVRLAEARKGKYVEAAEDDLRQAIKLKSDIPVYWMELARFLYSRYLANEAEKVFRDAIEANPDSVQLPVMYSIFLRRRDRSDEALKVLQQVVKRRPNETPGFIALAVFHKDEGDTDEAMKILETAKKVDDSDYRVYGAMAIILAERKEPEKAAQTLRNGLAAIERRSQSQPATQPTRAQERLKNAKFQLTVMLANALLDMIDAGSKDRDKLMAKVREHFGRIDEAAPKSPSRAKVAGRIALAEGDILSAVKLLEEAYAGYKTLDGKTVTLLVNLYLHQGLRGKAEEILDRILRLHRNPTTLVLKASLLADYHQYDKAKETLRDALRTDPEHAEARNLLLALEATERQGPLPPALKPTRRAVRLILNRAAGMMLAGQRQQALNLLQELYKKAPTDRLVVARLVSTCLAVGAANKAKAVLQQAIKVQPENADSFRSMLQGIEATPRQRLKMRMAEAEKIQDKLKRALAKAAICATGQEWEQCLKHLKDADAINPKDARVIVQMFRYGLSTRNWKVAEDYAAKAKTTNLDGCGGKLFAADLAQARQNFSKAIDLLEEALKDRPDLKRARVMLGWCYLRTENVQQAAAAFAAAARDDPGYAPAIIGMAKVTQIQGKWAEHAEWVNKAHLLAPADPYIREQHMVLMEERSKPEEIIRQRERIFRQNPADVQNRLRLGALYERTNRLLRAENMYRSIFAGYHGTRRLRAHLLAGFYARQSRFAQVDSIYNSLLAKVTDAAEKVGVYVDYGWLLAGHSVELPVAAFTKAIEVDRKDPRGYWALGRFLARRRQWLKAAEAFTLYLELRPQDRDAERQLVGFLIEAKKLDQADRRLQKLIATDASDVIAMTLRGILRMRQGNMEAAEKAFNQAIAENPNYGEALVNRAQLYLLTGEHTKAKMDLQAAGRLTNSPAILMQLARFHVSFRDFDSAQPIFEDILTRNTAYTPAIDGLIGVYMAQKSWPRLEYLLAKVKKAYPKNIRYPLAEVEMWRIREDMSRAVVAAAEAFKISPESPRAVSTYLLRLLSAKQYKKVLEVSQPYANKEGFGPWVTAIRAHSLAGLNKSAEAEKLFVAALQHARTQEMNLIVHQVRETYGLADSIAKLTGWLKVRPKSWDICILLGNLHVQADQASQGIQMYRKAIGFADKVYHKAEAMVRMGEAYYGLGKFREAEEAYLAALKIAPNHAPTLNNLAYLYVNDMNQPAKALPHSALAFKQMPYDRYVLDTYGWVLAALGDYGKAERYLNRALQAGGPIPPSLYHLGWVYEKTGRVTQARLRYQQALKLLADGKDDRLRQAVNKALERLKKRKG